MPESAEARVTAAVEAVLRLLDNHRRFLTSSRERMRRQLAAAGLTRCFGLLRAICTLRDTDQLAMAAPLVRAVVELVLVSLYVLLKGDDLDDDGALLDLLAAQTLAFSKLRLSGELPSAEAEYARHANVLRARGREPQPLNYADIAKRVGTLLEAQDPEAPRAFDTILYQVVYRMESTFGAHAGLGTLLSHVRWDPNGAWDAVDVDPKLPVGRQDVLAAKCACLLARQVYKAFAVRTLPDIEVVIEELVLAEQALPMSPR